MSVYVSIGRGDMDAARWDAFRVQTSTIVACLAGPIVTEATGTGYWEGEQEESFIVVGLGKLGLILQSELGKLCQVYEQDGIAVTASDNTFIIDATYA